MDDTLLNAALAREVAAFGAEQLVARHPRLFSRVAVFVSNETRQQLQEVICAVERIAALPGYREVALASAHPHARVGSDARGALLGFDFHLSSDGPQLIEINANPAGGLLHAVLRNTQRARRKPADALGVGEDERVAGRFLAMLEAEHARVRPGVALRRVAIVDDGPDHALYPELVLFQRLFEAAGIEASICDARALELSEGALRCEGRAIDLVCNRTMDVELKAPAHAALARAYVESLAVVTPHPAAYALYADRQRLITLSDVAALRVLGASDEDVSLLSRHVPRTVGVTHGAREVLWAERERWFFKPEQGYGAQAVHRGDELTKATFDRVVRERYVAQRIVPPSARVLTSAGQERALKLDVRCFAYEGGIQLVCARLHEGQTTNFRTDGGGFAPMYIV